MTLFVVFLILGLVGPMPALNAQATVQVLGSGGSDGLDPPPGPSCADPAFSTTATFDPLGNPSTDPRFGDGVGLATTFSLAGFTAEPGVVHFDEVITHDGYTTRPDEVPQLSERVHFELLLDGAVVGSTPPTPDLADGPRSVWLAASLGSVAVPQGANGLRIVHDGDGASPNSLIVTALCISTEAALSTVPDDEPAAVAEEPDESPAGTDGNDEQPAEIAPQTEPGADDGDGSAIAITNDSGDGTADGTVQPPGVVPEVLPETLPQLALTGADWSALTNLAALLLGSGLALVITQRRRQAVRLSIHPGRTRR